MNKKGFTLIELLVSFALITIVSLSLFKTVLTVQKKSMKDLSYNQYLSFAATFNNNIQKDFVADKITSFTSCGNNCYDIIYEVAGTKTIKMDTTNNTLFYGNIKEKLPNNYIFYGNLILELNKIDGIAVDNYNSILTVNIPIKSNLTEEYSNIIYTYQYDDRKSEAPADVFKTLTVNPNGGTYAGTTSNTEYYLLKDSSQELSIPIKAGYAFTGWSATCSSCLVNNTYTMSTANDTLTANWLVYTSMYTYTGTSTLIDDGNGNWRIKFLTSGTFTPLINMTIDSFLVGGGGGGGTSSGHNAEGGGGGGYTKTNSNIYLTANTGYPIVIGTGGGAETSGQPSTGFGYSAAGGTGASGLTGGAGGSGGGGSSGYNASYPFAGYGGSDGSNGGSGAGDATAGPGGAGQGTTTREFGEPAGTLYGAGGSGGVHEYGAAGWVRTGGATGGGTGGSPNTNGGAGTANTGGGGGGGAGWCKTGGTGGTGIVIIRNKR